MQGNCSLGNGVSLPGFLCIPSFSGSCQASSCQKLPSFSPCDLPSSPAHRLPLHPVHRSLPLPLVSLSPLSQEPKELSIVPSPPLRTSGQGTPVSPFVYTQRDAPCWMGPRVPLMQKNPLPSREFSSSLLMGSARIGCQV